MNPAEPAERNLNNYHGTGAIVLFVNRTFEWAVFIATFLSVLSTVPHHCARLTYFLHPKWRKINAVLIAPQLIALTGSCGAGSTSRVVGCPPVGLGVKGVGSKKIAGGGQPDTQTLYVLGPQWKCCFGLIRTRNSKSKQGIQKEE